MTSRAISPSKASWRDGIAIHPAADLFPLLGDDDLTALGEDIKLNGLKTPIAGTIENDKLILVDGRNRLDAMERVGLMVSINRSRGKRRWEVQASDPNDPEECIIDFTVSGVEMVCGDPTTYIISANIHRRHLTAETKRNLIAQLLRENPERSNRATAAIVNVDHKTVAAVRRLEENVGNIPHVDKVIDSKGRHQPASKNAVTAGKRPAAQPAKVVGSSAITSPVAVKSVDASEIAGLANGLCMALSCIDPILDRIAQIGIDVFWHQVDERVRNQVEGTAQFLQVLTTASNGQHRPAIRIEQPEAAA